MIDGEVEFKFGCHKETTAFVKERILNFNKDFYSKNPKSQIQTSLEQVIFVNVLGKYLKLDLVMNIK